MDRNIFKLLERPIAAQRKPKRYAKAPDVSVLKSQQKEFFKACKEFSNTKGGGMFCLEGWAGTGKTFTIAIFIEWYFSLNRTSKVAITAPTNKAVGVSYKMAEYTHTNLNYATIHSLLGLKENINDAGEQEFVKEWGVPSKIDDMDLLVVDETSQLPDELFEYLLESVAQGLKIIFVGDGCQIPPIGKKDCIPFSPKLRESYGIGYMQLTDIQRQAEGNPIINITRIIRENLHKPAPLAGHKVNDIDDEGRGVMFLNRRNDNDFYEILESFYRSEHYAADADFVKVLAYTNSVVDYMNASIREIIYDSDQLPKLCIGEKLIANKPIVWGDDIIFTNNEEMVVVSFEPSVENINEGQYMLKFYDTIVTKVNIDGSKEDKNIRIIHEDSEEEYNDILKQLAKLAKSHPKGSLFSKQYWATFHEFKKYFAEVKYSYALTCHKSQGSTYVVTIVMEDSITKARYIDTVEKNRIKYTADSRASDLLIIVNNK